MDWTPNRRGVRERRQGKKAQSREQRELAEQNIGANTEMFQGLYDQSQQPQETALANLAADPMLVAAQQRVLNRYGELGDTGFTALDRQALEQQQMQSRREEQSQRDSVLAAAARRGDTSGGNTLLASLMAQQGSANRDAQRGTDLALAGRDRALQALASGGQLAGQMREQGVGEQVARGSAMDQMRQWAAGNQQAAAGGLANARLGQAQYQLGRAEQLKPMSGADIFGTITDAAQTGLGLASGIQSLAGSGGGNKSTGGGGAAARTSAMSQPGPGLPQVPSQLPGAPSPNPTFARSRMPRRPTYT